MSGRGGRERGNRGGRGGQARGGRGGRGRGQNYAGNRRTSATRLCAALGYNVFDYGHKAAADQMRTSLEKLIQYVGTTYGQDISNELQNRAELKIPKPTHTSAVLARHANRETMVRNGQANIQQAREARMIVLVAAVTGGQDPNADMQLAELQNQAAQANYEATIPVPIEMTESENTQYNL